jgi:ABC-type multidrug transport system ATPase subunit
MFGRLFKLSPTEARGRANELLERFDLADAGDRPARTYSGGMRRRLDLASSLLTRPRVLFLDEPTTALDPRSRIEIWSVVSELVREGTTLLLTTQYLEEADQLAEQIAVIDHGRVIAQGTGSELKDRVGEQILEVELVRAAQRDKARLALTWDWLRAARAWRAARPADASGAARRPRDDRGRGLGAPQGGNRGERSRVAPAHARRRVSAADRRPTQRERCGGRS